MPGCFGRAGKFHLTWLDELPDAVLRGDYELLDGIGFIDFRYALHQPPGYSRRSR